MSITELRCTSCLAPIDISFGPVQRCVYCGTTLSGAPATSPSRAGGAFLEDIGPNKIMVIKVVYDTLHLGLKESKDLVERAPCVIGVHLDAAASERLREDLRGTGARVR